MRHVNISYIHHSCCKRKLTKLESSPAAPPPPTPASQPRLVDKRTESCAGVTAALASADDRQAGQLDEQDRLVMYYML